MVNNFEFLIPFAVFAGFSLIVKVYTDYRLKKMLIEREMINENLKYWYRPQQFVNPIYSVKWGLILIGTGLPLILKNVFPESPLFENDSLLGWMLVFPGVGFLLYYFISKKAAD